MCFSLNGRAGIRQFCPLTFRPCKPSPFRQLGQLFRANSGVRAENRCGHSLERTFRHSPVLADPVPFNCLSEAARIGRVLNERIVLPPGRANLLRPRFFNWIEVEPFDTRFEFTAQTLI
jgi:hypothetical protein